MFWLLLDRPNLLQSWVEEDSNPRQPIYQPERQALIKNICDIEGGRLGVGGLIIEFMSGGKHKHSVRAGRRWMRGEGRGLLHRYTERGLYDW